ncbi:KHK Ketohexokinase, partial [Herpetotheres cachinnans]|nr:KHK Ketohexokinase [Herpetotheres cachinnans]
EKRILCVGLVCLDIISVVEAYPAEDSDTRCVSQRWQRGGNASNSCTVLALLGAPCAFMGSLAPGHAADFVLTDLQRYGVDVGHVVLQPVGCLPTSVVIASTSRGTRTILHAHGCAMPLTPLSLSPKFHWAQQWVAAGQGGAAGLPAQLCVAGGVGGVAPPVPALLPQVFISKDVARHFGYQSAPEALRGLHSRVQPGATLICAWAEEGADAVGPGGELVHSDAFPPETLMDTLGAGDTFNAAIIFALSAGRTLQDALTFGCQIAGRKCGIQGFDGII